MRDRLDVTRGEGDTALFFDLLYFGELLTKLVVAGLTSAIVDDQERHQYRLEHRLVRASGIGEWVQVLNDLLTGPASTQLPVDVRDERRDLTQRVKLVDDAWQAKAIEALEAVCQRLAPDPELPPGKTDLRRWFQQFAWLRNRTRGHGAPTGQTCAEVVEPLERSMYLVTDNYVGFTRSWAHLHRSHSGKYRVSRISEQSPELDHLTREKEHVYPNGVYVHVDRPRRVNLISSDVDLSNFFFANGGFTGKVYEELSYFTDERRFPDAAPYLLPPEKLPPSESQGRPNMDLRGEVFTNLPPVTPNYVPRGELEDELRVTLINDHSHPVVTLMGPGGIGKTSLALRTLHNLTLVDAFFAIVWFSARDIDLLPHGPKQVQPHVRSVAEIADAYSDLMQPEQRRTEGFKVTEHLAEALRSDASGRTVFVLDNFETVHSPAELYRWIDTYIRPPNKVLITTRLRAFKGDYPIEVGGMTEQEFRELVASTASRLSIQDLADDAYVEELYREADGHPYVARVLLGEVAAQRKRISPKRIRAGRDDILDALFERTYAMLRPDAQRVFLTLCNWRSAVPRLGLEAALLRPANEKLDVDAALDTLERSSLVSVTVSDDGSEFISVPLTAMRFGEKKLKVNPLKASIEADTRILQAFGPTQGIEVRRGVQTKVERLFTTVARSAASQHSIDEYLPVVEYVARHHPPAWLLLADLYEDDSGPLYDLEKADSALRRYAQERPEDPVAWTRLADLSRRSGDSLAEIHALTEGAAQPDVSYEVISQAATRFNLLLARGDLRMDTQDKQVLAEQLLELLIDRLRDANATDHSRIAWLCLHLQQIEDARRYAERGLQLDPDNEYCLKLMTRFRSSVESVATI